MLKKLMISTAIGGLMVGAAVAQSSPPPASSSPPSSTQMQPNKPDASTPSSKPDTSRPPTAAPSPGGSTQFINSQKPDQYLASKFRGTDVIGADNQKIGDVSDILFDKSGKVEAYVISVGGFLGMGAKDVALAPTSFQVVAGDKSRNESDKLKLSMTKDELKQATNFEPYKTPRTTTGAATPGSMTRPSPMSPPASPAPR